MATDSPGNSPDLDPNENVGSIIKERVERTMIIRKSATLHDMKKIFKSFIRDINSDSTLLQTLLRSA